MRARRILAVASVLLLALAITVALVSAGLRSLDEPLNVSAPLRFKVAPGSRFARVAADLGERGVIREPRVWVLYARWKGLASAIKAGEYEIEPGATPRSLLSKMVNGQVLLHSFTIVDGWRVQDMLAAMKKNPDIKATLPDSPQGLMDKLGSPGTDAEGQFLPETYRFPSGATDLEVLKQAHAALVRELSSAWAGRDRAVPLQNADELLIVASIIQKESGVPQELAKIAGLYLHRLRIGMRLQADPTVIYGLGERYDGELHAVDLHTDGPYNTYTRAGLPPTPIALAGAPAIDAAAHPASTDALYFVASTRDDGSHVFSATLEEQNAAVARYVAHLHEKAAEASK
ncbi:MAG TPA: endolytic transglycosylase MltG [Steroidobacteraceae bacterium]